MDVEASEGILKLRDEYQTNFVMRICVGHGSW